MRTEIERRIGGEPVRVAITIGVMEAAADVMPEWVQMLAGIQRGHHRLVRAVIISGAKAAGRTGDLDAWFDGIVERGGFAPFAQLAFDAMSDAFAKAGDAGKKAEAAGETEQEAPVS